MVGSFVLTLTDKLYEISTCPPTHSSGIFQFHNSQIIDEETVVAECQLIFFLMTETLVSERCSFSTATWIYIPCWRWLHAWLHNDCCPRDRPLDTF